MLQWLIAAGIPVTTARQFAEPLKAAMALFDISTPQRQAAFIAQALIESQHFTKLEENLYYTTPERIRQVWPTRFKTAADAAPYARDPKKLANRVYAGRNGNGNEASGDGWNYRGRGFGITGRANYKKAGEGVGLGSVYVMRPELLAQPSDACLTFAHYWQSNGCNQMIDRGAFDDTTRIINGPARLHAQERRVAFAGLVEAHGEVLA